MRITITGVGGFVGRHLAKEAFEAGHSVQGITRSPIDDADDVRAYLDEVQVVDLAKSAPVTDSTDVVIHLAGLAAVGASFDAPRRYIDENSAMYINLAESILSSRTHRPRVVVASTGAVYASSRTSLNEGAALSTSSPYVVSKRTVEMLVDYYAQRGIDGIVARPFNHVGPGQRTGYLIPDLVAKLNILQSGDSLNIGNLESRRDYTDVRDVARAYLALAGPVRPQQGVYNVASGRSLSGRQILESVCRAIGRAVPNTEVDNTILRPSDASDVVGDAGRLRDEFGWEPTISIDESIQNFVQHGSATA